ncbi:gliding motility-associated lipoprotein GldH [Aquimarina sp. EL_43]|uniref:gliding motility lipoprotein GldH n=1 Tax=Aquimarina TaxID=290174 RepID=UPI0004701DF9|nr:MULTISPECIES: gliding motility lipoprotein GldH [Aquimarina]MBG6131527.1 gliding motility-associated lipoprotein GldH [Aquimarina sp. EL_35]MBG6151987.1 gliding motility-associated lipoprotein GldH [Aquimarina sp. EL_32]MBG6170069.1 gliding motility-associated lipoprotein GldH [Aquimarina sp. EL_43]
MIKLRFFLIVCIVIGMISCDDKQVFDTYHTVANAWEMDEKVSFTLPELDTTQSYNLFINIRNNNEYKYSNLFLISEMKFPNGKILTDTLEYRLAAPDGKWLGTGFSDLKENKLWYKENVSFKEKGNYKITIEHAMRKNGDVNGISSLEGITDIGFRIENAQNP